MKNTIKYVAFDIFSKQLYICSTKSLLAAKLNVSVDTIRRKELNNSVFYIHPWWVNKDVIVHKLKRNGFG
jgi:hypothetical protein